MWANVGGDSYASVWAHGLDLGVLELDLRHWVNDALMAIFFFVVGLEVKRELACGELQDRRAAALPAIAALGGVALPALIFLALTAGPRTPPAGRSLRRPTSPSPSACSRFCERASRRA